MKVRRVDVWIAFFFCPTVDHNFPHLNSRALDVFGKFNCPELLAWKSAERNDWKLWALNLTFNHSKSQHVENSMKNRRQTRVLVPPPPRGGINPAKKTPKVEQSFYVPRPVLLVTDAGYLALPSTFVFPRTPDGSYSTPTISEKLLREKIRSIGEKSAVKYPGEIVNPAGRKALPIVAKCIGWRRPLSRTLVASRDSIEPFGRRRKELP